MTHSYTWLMTTIVGYTQHSSNAENFKIKYYSVSVELFVLEENSRMKKRGKEGRKEIRNMIALKHTQTFFSYNLRETTKRNKKKTS